MIALDLGFRKTGWVVFENGTPIAWGNIETEKTKKKTTRVSDDNFSRAMEWARALDEITEQYPVQGMIMELPSMGALSAAALRDMSTVLGIAGACAGIWRLPADVCTPTENKKALTGRKAASKDEMMAAVRKKYPNTPWPKTKSAFENIADAAAVYTALRNGNVVKMFG